jgi:hypothetical protein
MFMKYTKEGGHRGAANYYIDPTSQSGGFNIKVQGLLTGYEMKTRKHKGKTPGIKKYLMSFMF